MQESLKTSVRELMCNFGNNEILLVQPSKHVDLQIENVFKKMKFDERFGKGKKDSLVYPGGS